MNEEINTEDKYNKAISDRQSHVNEILNNQSNKKIVVAGPGTGKTFLFKEVLKGKNKTLTLTFVNALVEDLSLELCGISDVKTLHGFARGAFGTVKKKDAKGKDIKCGVKISPILSRIIKEDAKILLSKDIDFDYIFQNLEDKKEEIEFYKRRKGYYDYYGYSDIVYAIVKYFEKEKDKIPSYDQVVVDEFQDFNKLEVALIELLSEKNPILLAGDDDQALYDFKSASAEYIRMRYSEENKDYTSFTLPYCSRCTRIIVEATNDIISSAIKNGNLKDRINKSYQYFEDINKDKESDKYPKIIYGQAFPKQIPWFIKERIEEIAEQEKKNFDVLIISPTKVQSRLIVEALKTKGFKNIVTADKKENTDICMLDGLKLLLDDGKSNLGWRIVAKFLFNNQDFTTLLNETNKDNPKNITELVNKKIKKEVNEMLKTLKALEDDKIKIDEENFSSLLRKIKMDPYKIVRNILKDKINSEINIGNPGIRKIPIKTATIQGSKGLSAEYVFITHFDDQYFIKNKDKNIISDQDICNFIVAMTRARKKVILVSSNKKDPTFLGWINQDRVERLS